MLRILPLLFAAGQICAQSRHVAITFDDLPRGGDLDGVPELGGHGLETILRIWREHGAELGNHTYSHPDLNRTPLDEYTADIARGEAAILRAQGRPRYFRHPFLHAGKDPATRRGLEAWLAQRGYRVAPVTLDNADWMFAAVYARGLARDPALARRVLAAYVPYMESIFAFFESRSKEVAGREFPQVLLLHANQLNADAMPALLRMMRRRGYRFVSLDRALRDRAYRLPDEYVGPGGFSWIHRWSKTMGLQPKGEPDEPAWIAEEFRRRPGT